MSRNWFRLILCLSKCALFSLLLLNSLTFLAGSCITFLIKVVRVIFRIALASVAKRKPQQSDSGTRIGDEWEEGLLLSGSQGQGGDSVQGEQC